MTIQKCLYDALLSRYEADIKDCVAKLTVYFNHSVGIGEHPDITLEMDQMLDKLAGAHDKKNALVKHFGHYNDTQHSKCPQVTKNNEISEDEHRASP